MVLVFVVVGVVRIVVHGTIFVRIKNQFDQVTVRDKGWVIFLGKQIRQDGSWLDTAVCRNDSRLCLVHKLAYEAERHIGVWDGSLRMDSTPTRTSPDTRFQMTAAAPWGGWRCSCSRCPFFRSRSRGAIGGSQLYRGWGWRFAVVISLVSRWWRD